MKNFTSWLLIFSSPILVSSSPNWLVAWVSLEIGSIGFIQIMKSKSSSESSILYFLIQVVASSFILLSMASSSSDLIINLFSLNSFNSSLISISILMKIGASPLHHWLIKTGQFLSMKEMVLLISIQKLAPLMLIQCLSNKTIMSSSAIMSALVGVFSQMSSVKIKTLILYSSLNHSGWMILVSAINQNVMIYYMCLYTMISWSILMLAKESNMMSIYTQESNKVKTTLILSLMSMAGIPPLTGFSMKWAAISCISKEKNSSPIIMSLLSISVANAFVYTRLMMSTTSLTPSFQSINKKNSMLKELVIMINVLMTPIILIFN